MTAFLQLFFVFLHTKQKKHANKIYAWRTENTFYYPAAND